MKEKDLQTKVNLYLRNRWERGPAVFELKICHEKSMPWGAVKDHQINALKIAKHGRLAYKIPDVGIEQKPFDCILLMGVPAYVLVMFYKKGQKNIYIIDVDVYEKESVESDRRSLTEERAAEIGELITLA